ncbi:MAG: hypothetical protein JNL19_10815 [Burkholderiales bacterium]|nr:hypothetical protein [Burkholderiales bacterium]
MAPLLHLATGILAAHLFRRAAQAVAIFFGAALTLTTSSAVAAGAGILDATWGGSGKGVSYPTLSIGSVSGAAIAVQPDGKVVLVGRCGRFGPTDFCVARLTADGILDRGFGSSGVVVHTILGREDTPTGVAILPDGKLLVVGTCYSSRDRDFCAVRYLPDGSIDTSFGIGGTVITNLGIGNDLASGFALLPDGRFVIAGSCQIIGAYDLCAARYLPDGRLDETFGSIGIVTISGLGAYSGARLIRQRDGKLVALGKCPRSSGWDFCIHRLLDNGGVDTAFGTQGRATVPLGAGYHTPFDIVEQPDGKLLSAGSSRQDAYADERPCVIRLLADGSVDSTFAVQGKFCMTPSGLLGPVVAITLQDDGSVLATLRVPDNFKAIRLTPSGLRDWNFGVSGVAQAFPDPTQSLLAGLNPSGIPRVANGAALQSDGKLLIVGTCPDRGACVARFNADLLETRPMVEYRYAPLDYYFITSRDYEISALDARSDWARTGFSFPVYGASPPGGAGLYRFFFRGIAKLQSRGSHFYTVLESERSALLAMNPTAGTAPGLPYLEGVDSYVFPPVKAGIGGRCADGQTPVYRLFRGTARFPDDPNHRFTTSKSEYDAFVALGWDGEGVNFCVPVP